MLVKTRKKYAKARAKLRRKVGIDWRKDENVLCSFLADYGFHGDVIAHRCGLTRAQVYYRLHQCGKQLRDYRDGKTKIARTIITKYKVVTPRMRTTTFTPTNLYPQK